MNSKQFWEIIDKANAQVCDWEEMYEPLRDLLLCLDTSEIIKWGQIFNEYHELAYKRKLWAAGYVINGGCSDDGFTDFRGWLIAQGKVVFLNALNDPESLANIEACQGGSLAFEEILGVSADAYFIKMNMDEDYDLYEEELEDHPLSDMEKSDMVAEIKYANDIDAEWDDDEENCLKMLLPKLCEAFDW